ncbi:unnamed protein product, partial [Cuscuta europaea]
MRCDALMNQDAHIETILDNQSMQTKHDYRIRLTISLDCVRYLLRLGLPFRGHDESEDSLNPALESGKISCGRGLHQESCLQRAGDTRWGSHYRSLVSLISMFSAVGDALDVINDDDVTTSMQKVEIEYLLKMMHCFDFVLNLHMMKFILEISNELSHALQRRDQDIVNAMDLVRVCKYRLQAARDDRWDSLFEEVCNFCDQHSIDIPNMNDTFIHFDSRGRPVRK